jgi:hypothetical protein
MIMQVRFTSTRAINFQSRIGLEPRKLAATNFNPPFRCQSNETPDAAREGASTRGVRAICRTHGPGCAGIKQPARYRQFYPHMERNGSSD